MSTVRVRLAASASQHMLFSVENCLIIYWQLPAAQQVLNINKKIYSSFSRSTGTAHTEFPFFFFGKFKLFSGHSVTYV